MVKMQFCVYRPVVLLRDVRDDWVGFDVLSERRWRRKERETQETERRPETYIASTASTKH
jgi:hypothetical protein